jgi:cyclopropane fatty-acyl-phospholipid synthase-like methyltransferase
MEEVEEQAKLNEQLWDSRAATYNKRFSFTRWTQKKLVSMLHLEENAYLLDVGCGTGWTVRYAAILANEKGMFYGVDNSRRALIF